MAAPLPEAMRVIPASFGPSGGGSGLDRDGTTGCTADRFLEISLVRREVTGIARLLDDRAPITCEAVWKTLPLSGDVGWVPGIVRGTWWRAWTPWPTPATTCGAPAPPRETLSFRRA